MKISKNIVLNRKDQKPILADVFYKEDNTKKPVVLFCHGYKGFKDWGAWDLVANAFAEAGFFFVKFNFSHNGGTMEQPIDFPDLEAFGQNNYSKELDDLDFVLNWVIATANSFHPNIDSNNISLIGHSRAGGIVAIKAQEDTRITKLISWAGVSDYAKRFPTGEALIKWKETGVMHVVNGRTKQEMPHYYQYFEDFKANEERLTISRAVNKMPVPQLIVHGAKDEAVDPNEAEDMFWWNPKSEIFWVPDANHVFGAKHPWEAAEMPSDLKKVVEKSISFINTIPSQ